MLTTVRHGKKGLIMGIWNSHTSVGNIVGASISGNIIGSCFAVSSFRYSKIPTVLF